MKKLLFLSLLIVSGVAIAYETVSPEIGETQYEAAEKAIARCQKYWKRSCEVNSCWQSKDGKWWCSAKTVN